MGTATAQIELDILEKKLDSSPHQGSVLEFFIVNGLDRQIAAELDRLWGVTKKIGSQVYRVGKIIVQHIIDFIKRNPNTAIAIAVSAAVTTLLGSIPVLGAVLGPLSLLVSGMMAVPLAQAYDMATRGEHRVGGFIDSVFIGTVSLAKEFFGVLINIFNELKTVWDA